jgi:hypothetical protein
MAEQFPATLQELLNTAGFTFGIGNTAIRSNMDIGPAKVRRRFTAGVDTINCSINLNYDEFTTFYNFFNNTLAGGTLTFNYNHPLTGIEEEFRFTGPPSITPLGGRYFSISMQWELIP